MAIDFTLTPELEDIRVRVRGFVDDVVKPGEDEIAATTGLSRQDYLRILLGMRKQAREVGLWLPPR